VTGSDGVSRRRRRRHRLSSLPAELIQNRQKLRALPERQPIAHALAPDERVVRVELAPAELDADVDGQHRPRFGLRDVDLPCDVQDRIVATEDVCGFVFFVFFPGHEAAFAEDTQVALAQSTRDRDFGVPRHQCSASSVLESRAHRRRFAA